MKPKAKSTRGRKSKALIWTTAPKLGVVQTFTAEAAFREKVRENLSPRALEIGRFWYDQYRAAGGRLVNGKHVAGNHAAGEANGTTALAFPGRATRSNNREVRIQQIIRELEDSAERLGDWSAQTAEPLECYYNAAVVRFRLAKALLAARPLGEWADAAFIALRTAPTLSDREITFLSEPRGGTEGSPQRLISNIAAALLDADAKLKAAEERATTAEQQLRQIANDLQHVEKTGLLSGYAHKTLAKYLPSQPRKAK